VKTFTITDRARISVTVQETTTFRLAANPASAPAGGTLPTSGSVTATVY
jgi:hypothetical protein